MYSSWVNKFLLLDKTINPCQPDRDFDILIHMRYIFLIAILFSSFFALPAMSDESEEGHKVKGYEILMKINKDSSVDVRESIVYDFGENERHGLIRYIPKKYTKGGNEFDTRISRIRVFDEKRSPIPFEVEDDSKRVVITIGSKKETVSGEQKYGIEYRIQYAFAFFDTYDELYLNLIGNEWPVPINNTKVTVVLPQMVNKNSVRSDCVQGSFGSTKKCTESSLRLEESGQKVDAVVFSQESLSPYEGMAMSIGFDKRVVDKPTLLEKVLYRLFDNWLLIVAGLITLIFIFYVYPRFGPLRGDRFEGEEQGDI